MTKDPVQRLIDRYPPDGAFVPSQETMLSDIQNLLALIRAYEEYVYSYADLCDTDPKKLISNIKSKIFGDKS